MESLIAIIVLVLILGACVYVLHRKVEENSDLQKKLEDERGKTEALLEKKQAEVAKYQNSRVEISEKLNTAIATDRARKDELSAARQEIEQLRCTLEGQAQEKEDALLSIRGELQESQKTAAMLKRENAQKGGQLEDLRKQLEMRPNEKREAFKIVTVGLVASGKTSLLLKWANPTWEVKRKHEQTSISRYAKVVSRCRSQDKTAVIDYEFELLDYGGELMVDAAFAAAEEGVDGMLIVLDTGLSEFGETQRIQQQKTQFSEETLKFFFAKRITSRCKTFIIFINKTDLFDGRLSEVEHAAKELYRDTLEIVERIRSAKADLSVEVVVGSAFSGHNTHNLFSHFVRSILPKYAYNPELIQGIQSEPKG